MFGKIKSDNLTPLFDRYFTQIMKNMKYNYAALDSVSVINKKSLKVVSYMGPLK